MMDDRHIIVVHHHPLVAEALHIALSGQVFVVHAAVTYREARTLLHVLRGNVEAVVAQAALPDEPRPGTLLRAAERLHPTAALVVVSAKIPPDAMSLPDKAVLLAEPFDREALMEAIAVPHRPPQSLRPTGDELAEATR